MSNPFHASPPLMGGGQGRDPRDRLNDAIASMVSLTLVAVVLIVLCVTCNGRSGRPSPVTATPTSPR